MDKVRIGFVGVGSMGQCAHLQNYVTVPDCEVVALAELRPQLADQVARRYGVPRVYHSHEELLANEQVDALVASQPFTRHGTLVPELLRAGVPVFTEKPLAASTEQGRKILSALADSGTWHMVGYHKRSDPATMAAKQEIDRLRGSGELGRLTYVRLTMPAGDWIAAGFNNLIHSSESPGALVCDPPPGDMTPELFEKYTSFVNYYIHQVNLLRHLLGEPYRVAYADPAGVLLAAEGIETGTPGVIEMSPYTTTVDWQETALVAFEHGYVFLELPAPLAHNRPGRVRFYYDQPGGQPREVTPTLPWVHAMRQQAINFVGAIRGDNKPPCEAPEALEDLLVAEQYIRAFTAAG